MSQLFQISRSECFVQTTHWNCVSCTYTNRDGDTCRKCNTSKPNIPLFQQCDHLNRLLHAMKHYQLLDIAHNPTMVPVFACFHDKAYPQMIDDYHHVISIHEEHLEELHNEIISDPNYGQCNYTQCNLSQRYHSQQRRFEYETTNTNILFLCDLLDAFHYWMMHMYQSGMRVKKLHPKILVDEGDEKKTNEYIDPEFKRIKNFIADQKKKYRVSDDRFTNNGNDKFQLQVGSKSTKAKTKKNETFIDAFIAAVDRESVSPVISKRLLKYIVTEAYDSDSLLGDLDDERKNSNILQVFHGDNDDSLVVHRIFKDLTRMICIFPLKSPLLALVNSYSTIRV